jgi:hypothetical protein
MILHSSCLLCVPAGVGGAVALETRRQTCAFAFPVKRVRVLGGLAVPCAVPHRGRRSRVCVPRIDRRSSEALVLRALVCRASKLHCSIIIRDIDYRIFICSYCIYKVSPVPGRTRAHGTAREEYCL